MAEEQDLKTLQEWNKEGRWIKKGEKAKGFRNRLATFSYEQTRAAHPKQTPEAQAEYKQTYEQKRIEPELDKKRSDYPVDDLEDDIPF